MNNQLEKTFNKAVDAFMIELSQNLLDSVYSYSKEETDLPGKYTTDKIIYGFLKAALAILDSKVNKRVLLDKEEQNKLFQKMLKFLKDEFGYELLLKEENTQTS